MFASRIKKIVVLGQIIMYGTLVLSLNTDDKKHFYIDVDYAPDGCSMFHDASTEIERLQFLTIAKTILELLNKNIGTDDEGSSYCYVEIEKDNGAVCSYMWPENLHSNAFREIGEQINSLIHNDIVFEFLSLF